MADMDVDVDVPAVASKKDDAKKRFEVKKVCTNVQSLGFQGQTPARSGMRLRCGHGVSFFVVPLNCMVE